MGMLKMLGKGPGFMGLAMMEVIIGSALTAWAGVDATSLAVLYGAVNIPVYGGGAWKYAAKVKNGASR